MAPPILSIESVCAKETLQHWPVPALHASLQPCALLLSREELEVTKGDGDDRHGHKCVVHPRQHRDARGPHAVEVVAAHNRVQAHCGWVGRSRAVVGKQADRTWLGERSSHGFTLDPHTSHLQGELLQSSVMCESTPRRFSLLHAAAL